MASNAIGGGAIDAEGFLKYLLHFHRVGYTRALNVTQRAAGANMSVDVNIDSEGYGGGLFATASAVPYFGYTNAAINAAVSTADPTNPRKDIVVAYIDLSLITTGTTNNLGAFKVKVVAGTAAASPSDPSAATIQASVGAGNPYVILARVTVTAAMGSVVNANITDLPTPSAMAMPYLWGGPLNTLGHKVPNQADGTLVTTTDVGSIIAAMLATGAVDATKLATNAIFLAYVTATTTSATAEADITSSSVTVTIPAGGRRILVIAWCIANSATAGTGPNFIINAGGSNLDSASIYMPTGGTGNSMIAIGTETPAAGSRTYKLRGSANNATSFQGPKMLILAI